MYWLLPIALFIKLCLAQECFNCATNGHCLHFSDCNEFTGLCECPNGFGGANCSQPVCGSLPLGTKRPLRPYNQSCECDEGWQGINCNMCSTNDACAPFMPVGHSDAARCFTGGELVSQNFHSCDVTNKKLVELLKGKKAQATFMCTQDTSSCDFQLWVDEVESFFCKFDDCEFNKLNYKCKNVHCECQPGELLCGRDGSIDISRWLTGFVRGPGSLNCNQDGKCTFDEPEMNKFIQSLVGDKTIELQCSASECLHYSQLPTYEPPTNTNFNWKTSLVSATIASMIFYAIFRGLRSMSRKSLVTSSSPGDANGLAIEAPILSTSPVGLFFKNINYEINGKWILNSVSGAVEPGNALAIMGGSGAGKTTLLEILAAKHKRGELSGQVFLNDSELQSESKLKRLIGFVDQTDSCLVDTQTVFEHVMFSALLRLPKTMSKEAKELRVLETLSELGIDKLSNTQIRHGLSGGEKRRVSIACELVTCPSILFLDEPTSGLDAFNAFAVVETLMQLAKSANRTIVFTIHQPRSNIVSLFDKIMLLADGKVVYTGDCENGYNYFASIGHECPPNYNFADFIVDLSMDGGYTDGPHVPIPEVGVGTNEVPEVNANANAELSDTVDQQGGCIPTVHTQPFDVEPVDQWQDFAYHRDQISRQTAKDMATTTAVVPPPLYGIDQLALQFKESRYASVLEDEIENGTTQTLDFGSAEFRRPTFFDQTKLLSIRFCNDLLRDPKVLFTHFGIAIGTGLLCGILYYNVDNSISGFQNRLGLFFFILALLGFSSLTEIALFAKRRSVFLSERANGYYHPLAYYLSNLVWDAIPLRITPPLVMGLIIYPMVGLNTESLAPYVFFLVLVVFNTCAALQTMMVSILVLDTGVASLVSSMAILFGILFAGLFLNQESLPVYFSVFKYLSMYHYAYETLSVNEVSSLTLIEDKFGLKIEVPGSAILSAFGFNTQAVNCDLVGVISLVVLFTVLGYVFMHLYLYELK